MSLTETVKVSISSPDRFYIGGDWVKPSSPDEIDVINASTEDVFLRVAEAKAEDMDRAVAAAREAFDHGPWPQMSHAERASYLVKIAAALEERALEIGQIWSGQMGVLNTIAQASGPGHGRPWRYYAGLAEEFPFQERHTPTAGGNIGLLVREPVGVVGAIIPWNGPMGLFETPAFSKGTMELARRMSLSHGFTVVGGGDSASAVKIAGDDVARGFKHISTGGGASLELIEGKKLPGVEALRVGEVAS